MNKQSKRYILRDASIRDRLKVDLDSRTIDPDKPMEVLIRPYKKNRSLAQNNLLWKWLTVIAEQLDLGHGIKCTPEGLKEEFQERYLGMKAYYRSDGTLDSRVRGTSELNMSEFTDFLNRIEVYAIAELGIQLPHPEDLYYEAIGKAA